jgi:hypothetical protein
MVLKEKTAERLWLDLFLIFALSFLLRIALIIKSPSLYAFDAYIFLLGLSSQYPMFTGLIKVLIASGFSVFMIRAAVAVLASCGCVAFYLFSRGLFNDKTIAGIAAFLMSIYPSFLIFSLVPYTESLFFVLFFTGLTFFTRKNGTAVSEDNDRNAPSSGYWGTGLFLGLACLTRYEAVLMLPLMFGTILWQKSEYYFRRKSITKLLGLCLSLFWAPVVLILYNYVGTPEFAAFQSAETKSILRGIFPTLKDMVSTGMPKLISEISARCLWFPSLTFLAGMTFAVIGCIFALIRERKKHLVFIVFIVLALGIQLLPIASNYRDYPGRIIGLRRHGMVPVVFLLLYLSYSFDLTVKKLSWGVLKKKTSHVLILAVLLAVSTAASFKATAFLITDYQKLYRNSYIQPYWVGKPHDIGSGAIVAISDRILRMRLEETGLRIYQPSRFENMRSERIEELLEQKRIKYMFMEKHFSPLCDRFIEKHSAYGFRQLADIGGWLFVYVHEEI